MFLAVATGVLQLPANARAGSVNLSAGFEYTGSESESENQITGENTETSSAIHRQRYNLNFSRNIYPYLVFSGGSNFRIDNTDFKFNGGRTEVENSSIRPHLELKLANPFILTGIGYQNSENSQKIAGDPKTTRSSTTYFTYLSLRPDQWPELDLRYSRTDRTSDPETIDSVEDRVIVHSKYNFDNTYIDYTFTQNENEDRKNDFRTTSRSHNGKIRYNQGYLDGKVSINTGYWFNLSETDLEGSGSALVPRLRSGSLFSLDLTPEDGPALGSISGLIDGNKTTPTSLDIGLAGDETTLTNIGVDLGFSSAVDTIRLWTDRELTPEISDSFTWTVYTSPDNNDDSSWQLHATISPGDFDQFENFFEISFPSVDTRFIKIAVMPLLPSVLGASGFPNILITEMEVFTTITSQQGLNTINHNLSFNLGWKASERTSLGYDGFYRYQKTDPSGFDETSLTNGIFVNHKFNDTFTGSARISRQDRDVSGKDTANSTHSAALRANYIETFRQTLTYSGSRTYDELGDSRSDGVFLRSSADLYRGISALIDTGLSWGQDADGTSSNSKFVRIGSKLLPNSMITLDLDYSANWSQSSGEEERLKETGSFQAFILPGRYLSIFARLRFNEDEDNRDTFQNYSVNWSPSPGGSVQLFMSYDQRILSEGNKEDKVFSPGFRWRMTRYAVLRTTYSWFDSKSDTELRNSRSLTANLRINL